MARNANNRHLAAGCDEDVGAMDFFFYGTLRDAGVRRRVLGRDLPAAGLEEAGLADFRAVFVAGASYPTVVACPGAWAPGLLARGLGGADAARLCAFEGASYQIRALVVNASRSGLVAARVFVVRGGVRATARPWTLAAWQRRFRAAFPMARPFRPH
jgi:hypothetical protein